MARADRYIMVKNFIQGESNLNDNNQRQAEQRQLQIPASNSWTLEVVDNKLGFGCIREFQRVHPQAVLLVILPWPEIEQRDWGRVLRSRVSVDVDARWRLKDSYKKYLSEIQKQNLV